MSSEQPSREPDRRETGPAADAARGPAEPSAGGRPDPSSAPASGSSRLLRDIPLAPSSPHSTRSVPPPGSAAAPAAGPRPAPAPPSTADQVPPTSSGAPAPRSTADEVPPTSSGAPSGSAPAAAARTTVSAGTAKRPHFLLVDDTRVHLEALEELLERGRFRVTSSSNGREALERARELRPLVVITDAVMPDLNGFDLCRRIKEDPELADTPVLLLTGKSDPSDILRALECGADGIIQRPYDERQVLTRVRALFASLAGSRRAKVGVGIEVTVGGQEHYLSGERLGILDLLISSFETAVRQKDELTGMNKDLVVAFERIRRLEEDQRALLENTGDALAVLDQNDIVRYVNPAAERLFALSKKELCGQPLDCPVDPGDTLEVTITRPRGGPRTVEVRASGITYEGSAALLASFHDVTEREQALKLMESTQREREEMRGQFLSHVSHELRSPIASINNFLQVMRRFPTEHLPEEFPQFIEVSMQNIERLRDMIEDLVEATRAQTGALPVEPTRARLAEVVGEVTDALSPRADEQEIELAVEMPPDLPLVLADPSRVRQVVTNLVENALKFTPALGRITVRAEAAEPSTDDAARMVRVEVEDTGCGIAEDDCTRIFDRLYQVDSSKQTKHRGLGLGLYICRELVLRHGGRIWVESDLGEGTTFLFTLPVFTLGGWLEAVLKPDQIPAGQRPLLVLLTVERASGGRLRGEHEPLLEEIHEVLGGKVLRHPDLLLPRIARAETLETFLTVTWMESEAGIPRLFERIEETLTKEGLLRDGELRISLAHTELEIGDAGEENLAARLADALEPELDSLGTRSRSRQQELQS